MLRKKRNTFLADFNSGRLTHILHTNIPISCTRARNIPIVSNILTINIQDFSTHLILGTHLTDILNHLQ